jgi:small neutral amino acid transporter SnatA (MarC family)
MKPLPIDQIFTLLFLMLGPFKLIGPFAKATRGADRGLVRQIAFRAAGFSTLALLVAAFLGEIAIQRYGIPLPILMLAGGIIFFLVALRTILEQFTPSAPTDRTDSPPTLDVAISPVAFPGIVTPYGIAALILLVSVSTDNAQRWIIGGMLLAIMLVNLVAMLQARRILSTAGLFLQIVSAVLAIIQVALGLNIIFNALRNLLA